MKKFVFIICTLFLSCKSADNPLLVEYKNKALHDIKVDSVKTFTYGLVFISPVDAERKNQDKITYKRDSIYKKYGLYIRNLGCVIGDKKMDKATKVYHQMTDDYLENRNGKQWRERMDEELNNIYKK
ncbi:hypothetical protein EYY60_02195 [Flavobacterium zhairuonense]|uniref:FEKKY domain-containing protein n=1 Tax=Flavobacterium zhairuonense TaxID=2493631 RepID=UPI00104E0603|nr:hypothetical protein [Flavobacterium zhairuonense]KAF2515506.1 hypothetical protein EYY60_02195 [Flavobacterium zhairuonense]